MLGLALGDACGAPLEGGPLERLVWRLLCLPHGSSLRWTDDTQMSLVLAESLARLKAVEQDELARGWAAEARWSRGYGPGAWKLLKRVRAGEDWRAASRSVFPEGSWGNGGAMRSAPLGFRFSSRPDELARAAAAACEVTHAHPLAVEGAVLMARAAALVMEEPFEPQAFLESLAARASEGYAARLRGGTLSGGMSAVESVPTALTLFARNARDFRSLLAAAAAVGGDVDTIGAMAGALYGALNGSAALPGDLLERLEDRPRVEAAGAGLA